MTVEFNSAAYFTEALVSPTGFREYDARWVIEQNDQVGPIGINYIGVRELGYCLGKFIQESLDAGNEIVVGHDYRRYSENVKNALVIGLLQAGMAVKDIGLTVSPGAYFAQFDLGIPCVAAVTASHNDNGWTGVKIGHRPASTFGPEEMAKFRDFTLKNVGAPHPSQAGAGSYEFVPGMRERYIEDLVTSWEPRFTDLPRIRVAVETGNGTAGPYMPEILTRLGFDVVVGNVQPDWDFPNFNPNPENISFLRSVEALVRSSQSDIGICLDGDGDRLGVVDDRGELVFSDRIGLVVAKHLEEHFGAERPIVIDVKSTSLFETELKSPVVWAKTGHSYVKAKVAETRALAGFERSGHFFFQDPLGRGYDDGCVAALAVLWMVCSAKADNASATLSGLLSELPPSFASPNRQPYVSDEEKYEVVDRISEALVGRTHFAGQAVVDTNLLNGVRITLTDRSWLLVRASSNSPNLVIIAEAFDKEGSGLRLIDQELRAVITELDLKIGTFEPLYEY